MGQVVELPAEDALEGESPAPVAFHENLIALLAVDLEVVLVVFEDLGDFLLRDFENQRLRFADVLKLSELRGVKELLVVEESGPKFFQLLASQKDLDLSLEEEVEGGVLVDVRVEIYLFVSLEDFLLHPESELVDALLREVSEDGA